MNPCITLLAALGLLSTSALAQSDRLEPAPGRTSDTETITQPAAEPGRQPMPTMGGETTAPGPATEDGALSSGASGTEMAPSGSGGQLITPAIAESRPAAATAISVQPQTENDVTYMCGGIGDDESTYMKKTAARDYDLMMTFAEKNGNYVADVDVSIKDARGKTVLNTTCDGPILLVDLPAGGGYRIHAETAGRAMNRTVQVKGGKGAVRQLAFAWPSNTAVKENKNINSGKESAGGNGEDK